jgi:hypothetical protein
MKSDRYAFVVSSVLLMVLSAGCGGDDDSGGGVSETVVSAAGAEEVAAAVEEFRDLLGEPNNGGNPANGIGPGRREINWDAVPDDVSAPNFLPDDFFNDDVAPRARGILFSTPGDGVQVSADADNPSNAAVRFGNINPAYEDSFVAFSEERLFSPVGSNIAELFFVVPGSQREAGVSGFGAVYTGVDRESSSLEFFDRDGRSLGRFSVPQSEEGLSFLGVVFSGALVRSVRIEYGNSPLGPDESDQVDVAVMDDFIYGEPQIFGDPG